MTKGSTQRSSPDQAARLMRWATYASVAVASLLIAAKLVAWNLSGSVSLLATLIDSGLDALASLINLFAVHHALTPADEEHRFGHGKAEALAGLGQAVLIIGSGLFLLSEATSRLLEPEPIEAVSAGMWVMVLSIALTLVLLRFQRHVILRTGSTAIAADALHYRTDLLVNGSVLLALGLAAWGWQGFDAVFALGIGMYILYSAWEILRQAADHLMDRELPEADRARIETLVAAHPQITGFHDLRTRSSGTSTFIQLHVELPDEMSLVEAHRISEAVEKCIEGEFPGADILIHLDPQSVVGVEPRQEFQGTSE